MAFYSLVRRWPGDLSRCSLPGASKMIRSLLTLALLAISTSARANTPPPAFDLDCGGVAGRMGQRTDLKPFERHLMIDLADRWWCEEPCRVVRPILAVTPQVIILRDVLHAIGNDLTSEHIDLQTYNLFYSHDHNGSTTTGEARCSLLPFAHRETPGAI